MVKFLLKPAFWITLLIICFLIAAITVAKTNTVSLFEPKGMIAAQQKNVIITSILLMLIIVIPVYLATFIIAYRYRATNTKAKYSPNLTVGKFTEAIWWILPTVIIIILSVFTWIKTHQLDPYKPILANTKSMTIQVVALRWKWLFIYPEHNIASLNFIQFPKDTPINFELTADAPMNSFWIPQLGGQMYAMTGMGTKLHLIANEIGDYNGSSAEVSGDGFSEMRFVTRVSSKDDFDGWVKSVKVDGSKLGWEEYKQLAKPSKSNPVVYFSSVEENLYNKIIMQFMDHNDAASNHQTKDSQHQEIEESNHNSH